MSGIEYDSPGKLNSSFQVGAETLSLLLLYADLMFSMRNKYSNYQMQYFNFDF